jgi:hypothetical protein
MATITTDTYLDDGTARTAGEVMTINGGVLTIRTDTRWHAGAPQGMTGTLGSPTISATLGGGLTVDARNVRWLAYDTGTGNVPAIGTSITQGGVSGYLLGVYDTITSAPTAVGAAMPADGFIKFREVTAGPFTTGALTGIGASATAADVAGWIEVVMDQAATITTSRVGSGFVTRGDWFYLDDTSGSIGQVLQVPTNGGGDGTVAPGVWIETAPASDEYEYWPSLSATGITGQNGWLNQAIGEAEGQTDSRQNFVKGLTNGQMQIGETYTQASTYASVSQASTYTTTAQSSTYTWVGNVVKVTFVGHGHFVGEEVYVDFTSGSGTPDGLYTITAVTGPDTYEFALTGSGTGGNCSVIKVITVSFTAHGLKSGEQVYLDFTTGAATDGVYTVYTTAANTYTVLAPRAATSGNATAVSRMTISFTAHGMAAGTEVYCDFTSGTGVDGVYEIRDLPTAETANAYTIACAIAPGASGNVTVRKTIGNVPASGCKTRVPNVFLRQSVANTAATYNLATNVVTVTLTSHGKAAGDIVYVDFLTGNAVENGPYTVASAPNANTFTFALTRANTSGNCAITPIIDNTTYAVTSNVCTITSTAHGRGVGETIYHEFTTGGAAALDGYYTITSVAANTYTFALTTANTSGDVTLRGGRSRNQPPHATVATRPDFTTSGAGVIDCEYAYGDWYFLAAQPYTFEMHHCGVLETISLSECATSFTINDCGVSHFASQALRALQLTTNLNGGTVTDGCFMRTSVPASNGVSVETLYCQGIDFLRNRIGISRHDARTTGFSVAINSSSNITLTDTQIEGIAAAAYTSNNVAFYNTDYCDRLIGKTSGAVTQNAFAVSSKASDILIDGVTFGKNGTLERQHPNTAILTVTNSDRVRLRNAGTRAAPLAPLTDFGRGINCIGNAFVSAGINTGIKVQNVFLGRGRTATPVTTRNDDNDVTVENVHMMFLDTFLPTTYTGTALNMVEKAIGAGTNTVGVNPSVYGTHFHDEFNRDEYGRVVLVMNEPTADTADVVDVIAGTPKFTSAPSIAMATLNDEVVFTMPYYAYGHTSFLRGTATFPTMSGSGGTGNHDAYYKIDKNDGSGFNASWRNLSYRRAGGSGTSGLFTLSMTSTTGVNVDDYVSGSGVGANAKVVSVDNATRITVNVANASTFSGTLFFNQLPNEAIDPADGFKLSLRFITTVAASANTITYFSIDTRSTAAAQEAIDYPLDPVTTALTLTNLPTGTEVHVYRESDGVQLAVEESTAGSTFTYDYTWVGTDVDVYITVLKIGYQFKRYDNQTLGSTGKDIEVFLTLDRNYRNP